MVINTDLTWQVFVCGRQVPATCTVIRDFPANMKPEFFLQVLEQVGQAVLCPGNPEEELVCDLRVKVPEALHCFGHRWEGILLYSQSSMLCATTGEVRWTVEAV